MEDNSLQQNLTGECSYKYVKPNFGKNSNFEGNLVEPIFDTEPDFEANTNFEGRNQESCHEKDTVLEDSSDDFVPDTDSYSESSSDSDDQQGRNKFTKKVISHITAEEIVEEQEMIDDGEANLDLDNVENNEVVKKSRGRKKTKVGEETKKRKRDPKHWEKNIRKRLKVQGKEYYTLKGKKKPERKIKEPCDCRKKCFEKFSPAEREEIFKDFYNLSF